MIDTMRKEDIYSVYISRIFPKISHIRGATRLKSFLRGMFFPQVMEDDISYFIDYRGVRMRFNDQGDFVEIINGLDLVAGYTRERSINEDDIVVDAGAYPGEFTLYAAEHANKVIAIEADEENADRLEDILELNNIDNVELIHGALWSSEERLELEHNEGHDSKVGESGELEVKGFQLDSLDQDIDFVKMDIEGAEVEAIKGAHVAIASYHEIGRKESSEILHNRFGDGYSIKTGFPPHKTTWLDKE